MVVNYFSSLCIMYVSGFRQHSEGCVCPLCSFAFHVVYCGAQLHWPSRFSITSHPPLYNVVISFSEPITRFSPIIFQT